MKKSYIILAVIIAVVAANIVSLSNNGNEAMSSSGGAPAGHTGSPGDGFSTCTACHLGPAATAQSGWITSTIPAAGYLPNTTYTIIATATRAGHTRFGF